MSWLKRKQSPLFARPNLGLFLGGALTILVAAELVSLFTPQAFSETARRPPRYFTAHELLQLLEEAENAPTPATYRLLAEYYERRHDLRRAMNYHRRAVLLEQGEPGQE